MDAADLKTEIRRRALDLGFTAIGFTSADTPSGHRDRLELFVGKGHHGEMDWLARDPERRGSPKGLWPEVRSIIALGTSYAPEADPMEGLSHPDQGVISVYARGRDYHDVIKKRLKALGRWLAGETGCELKVFVDTAPVMEKPLAEQAGIGWQGKHTNLVSRQHGSWLFLSEIYVALDLPPDPPETDHCGTCQACLDICPTNAFVGPRQLDARRCISYLTIEHKGPIPEEFHAAIGNRIYGCDDCLAVCPWNKFAEASRDAAFFPREELTAPKLAELAKLDEAGFRKMFAGSPIKRLGWERFMRNVRIAMRNAETDKW